MWLLVLVSAAGCWQPRYFEPRENLTGASPEGLPAAVYEVARGDDHRARGQVRVWSDGARARYGEDDEEVVDLHVAFELENNGAGALELDLASLQVQALQIEGGLEPPLAPSEVEGGARAEPGATTRVDAVFRPPTAYPSDIDSFDVRFAVRDSQGGVVSEVTPFAPMPTRFGPGRSFWGDPAWNGAYWGAGPWGFYGSWGWMPGAVGRRCR